MSKKTFLMYKIATAAILGIVVSISVNFGNWYLPAIAIIVAFVFLYTLKNRVKEVISDERDYIIAGKASYVTITSYSLISVLSGIILFILGKENVVLYTIGHTLLYSACFLMLLYSVLFKIYINWHD